MIYVVGEYYYKNDSNEEIIRLPHLHSASFFKEVERVKSRAARARVRVNDMENNCLCS
jgi:ubiquinone biosynthesis protein UbiJ